MLTPRVVASLTSLTFTTVFLSMCSPRVSRPAEDPAVYAAALDTLAQGSFVLLLDSTSEVGGGLARSLPKAIPSRLLIRFVSATELAVDPTTDLELHWRRFYDRFPGAWGWFSLSSIEYGRGGTWANVYYQHHCGSVCGSDGFVELSREGIHWRILSVRVMSVS